MEVLRLIEIKRIPVIRSDWEGRDLDKVVDQKLEDWNQVLE
jgi:hypothetical protein